MPKRGYHHGQPPKALIDGALKLIEDRAPQGSRCQRPQKQAGVTPCRRLSHFEGREDLIAEGALARGTISFAELMEAAYQIGQPRR